MPDNKKRIMPSSQRWTATPSPQEALEEVLLYVDREIEDCERLKPIFNRNNDLGFLDTKIAELNGRLRQLRDLKKRLPNEIKAIYHIEQIEDMAWDGAH